MKYKSLKGLKINVGRFIYWFSTWNFSEGTNQRSSCVIEIDDHKICDLASPLYGQECVYEKYSSGFFIYPISELERTKQIPAGYLLEENYEIY